MLATYRGRRQEFLRDVGFHADVSAVRFAPRVDLVLRTEARQDLRTGCGCTAPGCDLRGVRRRASRARNEKRQQCATVAIRVRFTREDLITLLTRFHAEREIQWRGQADIEAAHAGEVEDDLVVFETA